MFKKIKEIINDVIETNRINKEIAAENERLLRESEKPIDLGPSFEELINMPDSSDDSFVSKINSNSTEEEISKRLEEIEEELDKLCEDLDLDEDEEEE